MAVTAIDSIITHVMLVTELNRLRTSNVGLRNIGRPIHLYHDPDDPGQNEDSPEDTELGERVGTGMKNLGHWTIALTSAKRAAAYHTVAEN